MKTTRFSICTVITILAAAATAAVAQPARRTSPPPRPSGPARAVPPPRATPPRSVTERPIEARGAGPVGAKHEIRAWPTGDRATSAILIERTTPGEVRVGEEFGYEIGLTNITRSRMEDLVLIEQFPTTFKVKSISPEPTHNEGGIATWNIPALEPGSMHAIHVTGSTDRPDQLDWCATLTFKTHSCISTRIVEPQLVVEKIMPAEVTLCQDIPIQIRVSNRGSGVARNVMVTDNLPPGLATPEGKTGFTFRAGDLATGQSREATVTARAAKTGSYTNTAKATEEGGLSAEASATTVVRQPVLQVTKVCPDVRYVGRPITFEITVQNSGDAVATGTTLTDPVPAGTSFVNADGGGRLDGGRVNWSLGNMAPGTSQVVHLTVMANEIGKVMNQAMAKAFCAEAQAACETIVKGIPAILIEVVDDPDPIEVGTETTYTIEVVNQGSAVGTNIRVECQVSDDEQFLSAAGPTNSSAAPGAKTIRFDALPALAPKAKAVWKVVVRGVRQADTRFRTIMQSDQMTSPVEETESTHIYQ